MSMIDLANWLGSAGALGSHRRLSSQMNPTPIGAVEHRRSSTFSTPWFWLGGTNHPTQPSTARIPATMQIRFTVSILEYAPLSVRFLAPKVATIKLTHSLARQPVGHRTPEATFRRGFSQPVQVMGSMRVQFIPEHQQDCGDQKSCGYQDRKSHSHAANMPFNLTISSPEPLARRATCAGVCTIGPSMDHGSRYGTIGHDPLLFFLRSQVLTVKATPSSAANASASSRILVRDSPHSE
jgi:hypothetical protein